MVERLLPPDPGDNPPPAPAPVAAEMRLHVQEHPLDPAEAVYVFPAGIRMELPDFVDIVSFFLHSGSRIWLGLLFEVIITSGDFYEMAGLRGVLDTVGLKEGTK